MKNRMMMFLAVGLVVATTGTPTLAAEKTKSLTDLSCAAGQIAKFNGTVGLGGETV